MERQLARKALDCALALARTPALASAMRAQTLPDGVRGLLGVVAGEPGALEQATLASGMSGREIVAAAELYIQQVMLHPKADAHRTLGVACTCDRQTARTHMRLLMTWLHPDHNDNAWRSAFAHRVLAAWKQVSKDKASQDKASTHPEASRLRGANIAQPRTRHRLPWVQHPLPRRLGAGSAHQRPVRLALASTIMLLASTLPAEAAEGGAPFNFLWSQTSCADGAAP